MVIQISSQISLSLSHPNLKERNKLWSAQSHVHSLHTQTRTHTPFFSHTHSLSLTRSFHLFLLPVTHWHSLLFSRFLSSYWMVVSLSPLLSLSFSLSSLSLNSLSLSLKFPLFWQNLVSTWGRERERWASVRSAVFPTSPPHPSSSYSDVEKKYSSSLVMWRVCYEKRLRQMFFSRRK